ncbi:MAG: YkgJ family cysteine cluster protein [Bacillota bacterium]
MAREEREVFGKEERFRFECHHGLACFGQCCRDINIFLTPYDVIRLRKRLGISSSEFLRKYTEQVVPPGFIFPFIYLKMNEEDQLKCPFVAPGGCSVYTDRPWSCRMAPVDIVGPGSFRFAFDRKKCLGLDGEKEWTVGDWMRGQEMEEYDLVEYSFKDIPLLVGFTGEEALDKKVIELFKIVCYDIDRFRDFAVKNRYLIREGGVSPKELDRSLNDDVELLKTGIEWFVNVTRDKKVLKKVHV